MHRRQLELHAAVVGLRRHREESRNVKLDVGRDRGSTRALRGEGERADRLECPKRHGQHARPLESSPPGHVRLGIQRPFLLASRKPAD